MSFGRIKLLSWLKISFKLMESIFDFFIVTWFIPCIIITKKTRMQYNTKRIETPDWLKLCLSPTAFIQYKIIMSEEGCIFHTQYMRLHRRIHTYILKSRLYNSVILTYWKKNPDDIGRAHDSDIPIVQFFFWTIACLIGCCIEVPYHPSLMPRAFLFLRLFSKNSLFNSRFLFLACLLRCWDPLLLLSNCFALAASNCSFDKDLRLVGLSFTKAFPSRHTLKAVK